MNSHFSAAQSREKAARTMDHKLLVKLLELSASPHGGEALQALRRANAAIRDAGLRWLDLLEPAHELEVATAAAAHLLAEIEALKAENSGFGRSPDRAPTWRLSRAGALSEIMWVGRVSCPLGETGLVQLTDA
jgi:hypothetical protein